MPKKLLKKEIERIINGFLNGKNIEELAKEHNCTKITINRHLKKNIDEKEYKLTILQNNKKKEILGNENREPLADNSEDFVNSFIEQSEQFENDDFEPTDKIIKKLSQTYSFDHYMAGQIVPRSHPLPMLRIGKLNSWIKSGEYDEVINKEREKITIIYCSKCNEIIDLDDKFCGFCGSENIRTD